jgi:hypothetical protein
MGVEAEVDELKTMFAAEKGSCPGAKMRNKVVS